MKSILVAVFLFGSIAFARPQPRFELLGYTESFGPKLSVQRVEIANIKSDRLLFVGDTSKVGRPSFEYFLDSIVVTYSDGNRDQAMSQIKKANC